MRTVVVVAAGISPFAWRPPQFRALPQALVSHSSETTDLARFAGRKVAVVGAAVVVGGVSVSLASTQDSAPLLPDVFEEVPSHLQVQNTQQREWLRFTTVHVNIGAGNLQIRGGGQIAPCDIDGIHYDQCTVATQEILDASGNIVATDPLKGWIAGFLGLFVACIGQEGLYAYPRFSFGNGNDAEVSC